MNKTISLKPKPMKKKLVIKNKLASNSSKQTNTKISISDQIANKKKNLHIHKHRPAIAKKTPETAFDEIIGKVRSKTSNEVWETPPESLPTEKPEVVDSNKRVRGKDNKQQFQKKEEREEPTHKIETKIKPHKNKTQSYSIPKNIEITEHLQIGELAKKLRIPPNVLIGKLMRLGEMATISKIIDSQTAILIASEFNCKATVVSLYESTVVEMEKDLEKDRETRPPVVTIMGHVDHGKTSLLDAIRKSRVAASEAGAITQHIGAYQVTTKKNQTITFLDTPGHEAFTAMRARGASVTDIVIIVVAADDGIKKQTLEAIAHARDAKVPLIVALNKIDLPNADIKKVEEELVQNGLASEDMGGDTIVCKVSAHTQEGLDHLLEMIVLQSELLDLKANNKIMALGTVLEAHVDLGRGPTATVLVEKGILRIGDPYVAGCYSGTVRAMFNDLGNKVKEAHPSMPVEIIGLEDVPEAGEVFQVVGNEKYAREIASQRKHYNQMKHTKAKQVMSFQKAMDYFKTNKELNLIIKADKQGSAEAIADAISKILTLQDLKINIVHSSVGGIIESDINLAIASNSLILGFHVRATTQAQTLSEKHGVEIQYYKIIYNLINDVKKAMAGLLEPDKVEQVQSRLEIRDVFKISKLGEIAGCMVVSGKIHKNHKVRLLRDEKIVYTGSIKNLKRLKNDATEVAEGYECGVALDKFHDIKVGDVLESFTITEVAPVIEDE